MTAPASPSPDPTRGIAMLATALGAPILAMLEAPDTLEVIVNPDGRLWLEQADKGRNLTQHRLDAAAIERVIRLVATLTGAEARRERPIVSAELPPGGERFEGILPPVSRAPCFAIRKPAAQIFSLDDYAALGIASPAQVMELKRAIRDRDNIVVAGGTGSGKTTLANAMLREIAGLGERIVLLEDTRELQCIAEDVVALRTQPGLITLSDLVRSTLRLRPDRIIVGEVRGAEALDLLKAWNTGHPGGVATLHANSARAVPARLEQMMLEVCETPPRALIHDAIDLIVFIERGGPNGRRISEILTPKGPRPFATDPAARGENAHHAQLGTNP